MRRRSWEVAVVQTDVQEWFRSQSHNRFVEKRRGRKIAIQKTICCVEDLEYF